MVVRIGKPMYGGTFAASNGAESTFVLPGELVRGSDEGSAGMTVLEPAEGRVFPRCVHFGVCGGCHYQHAVYKMQPEIKREILAGLLGDAGLGAMPSVEVLAGEPWGYRNRIRLRVQAGADGALEFGYSLAASNVFLPVRMCPIAAPVLWRAVEALRAVAAEKKLRGWLADASEVELFSDGEQKAVQMQLFLHEAGPVTRQAGSLDAFALSVQASLPELTGVGAMLSPDLSRRKRRSWEGAGWGADGLKYVVDGRSYWVRRGAFFQVNRFLVDDLVRLVIAESGGGGELAWDLFAGVGLFSRALAERFGLVVAVEGGEQAAGDLLAAARAAPGLEAVHRPVFDFLVEQQTQRERPEVVVLDPPRAGLGSEGAALLARIAPERVVYVSCDPVTLARDLRVLVGSGYRVGGVHLVDLFPQTFHIETVVRLERGPGRR